MWDVPLPSAVRLASPFDFLGGFEDLWGHQQQILDMIEAIRDDRSPAITGEDGQKTVELVLAIYQSARSGQPVHLPLVEA
jgi:predicted dehydrogenase